MKKEEPHCKAVRLFPLVEHRGFVWLTCGGGDGSRTHVRKEFSVGVSGVQAIYNIPSASRRSSG